ncbi:MAG TPA: DUF2304 domain-containing protein [Gemmatales bacterium]|nr:DUF2304 domain-containing protein [Gemmatales bacterium]
MNLFQIVAVTGLLLLLVIEWLRVVRYRISAGGPLFRSLIWLAAIGFILFPDSLTYIARWLGIGVGANLLLYLLTFAFLAVSFMLYARIVHLRRQMTQLVRHLALSQPLPPAPSQKANP